MRCVIWPFYSQQDKRTGQFLLKSCGAAKQLAFLAKRIAKELGWGVKVVVPASVPYRDVEAAFGDVEFASAAMVPSNPVQQVHWDCGEISSILKGADIAILNHELLSIPVRACFPKLKIVQMCSVLPDRLRLFKEAWSCADLVVGQGAYAKERIHQATASAVTHWELAVDERNLLWCPAGDRPIDVLFVQRCSANNYTHHEEFLRAMELFPDLRTVFVDVTSWLKMRRTDFEYISGPEEYTSALYRSKVAVALNDNMYGGLSIREAAYAGCVPVVLAASCYLDLVGPVWPYACTLDPKSIADAVMRAVQFSGDRASLVPMQRAKQATYQAAWPKVKEDLCSLLSKAPTE